MTREEAIKKLSDWFMLGQVGEVECIVCFDTSADNAENAIEMAIAALREQEERSKAESEGRVVVLPCKVGDTIYQLRSKKHARGIGVSPRIVSSACVWTDGSYALCHQGMTYCQSRDLGKTWFLTQGEAEEALRRLEDT